jgi:hypothetical protein
MDEFIWPEPFKEEIDDEDVFDLSDDYRLIEKWIGKHKKIHVRVVTWNLGAKNPPSVQKITSFLLPRDKYLNFFVTCVKMN